MATLSVSAQRIAMPLLLAVLLGAVGEAVALGATGRPMRCGAFERP